jgi:hypothetical protein
MFDTVRAKYRALGVAFDKDTFDSLSDVVCKDMQKGGAGYFTVGDVSALSESGKDTLARSMWLVFAQSCYPDDYVHSDADMEAIVDSLVELFPEYKRRMEAAGLSLASSDYSSLYSGSDASLGYSGGGSSGSNYSSGDGYAGSSSSGGGYSTMCNDGTFSQSGGKRGACSWHGGVSR